MNKTYRITYALYASVRTNLIPKPGTLTVSADGVLTMTDTTNGSSIIQKPFSEIVTVRPANLFIAISSPDVLIYVGLNEAYKVRFGSDSALVNDGLASYEKLLQGDKAGAIDAFNRFNDKAKQNPDSWKSIKVQQYADFQEFLEAAKQAGVYSSALKVSPGTISTVAFLIAAILLIVTFFVGIAHY